MKMFTSLIPKIKQLGILFIACIFLVSCAASAVAAGDDKKTSDDQTGGSYKTVIDCPAKFSGEIQITTKNSNANNYKVSDIDGKLLISDKEKSDKKAKLKFNENTLKKLKDYNGKQFSYVHINNEGVVDTALIYNTADVMDKNGDIEIVSNFSEVVIGGAVGYLYKTVNGNVADMTITVGVPNATAMYIIFPNVQTYQVWDESNISTYPRQSNVVAAWPFEGNNNDISTNANNLGATTATPVNDRFGNANSALRFDGNDQLNRTSTASLNITDEITMLAGIYRYPEADGTRLIYKANQYGIKYDGAATLRHAGYVYSGGTKYAYGAVNESKTAMYNWTHYAVSISPTTDRGLFYKNGELSANSSTSYTSVTGTTANLNIGSTGSAGFWNSTIDYTILYNTVLPQSIIREFTLGYAGTKFQINSTGTETPLTSTNQSVAVPKNLQNVKFVSNSTQSHDVSLLLYFVTNYTKVQETDNSTHHLVNLVFTPTHDLAAATLTYPLAVTDRLFDPSMVSNQTGATVERSGDNIVIDIGDLTTGTSKYYDVALEYNYTAITDFTPIDTTPAVAEDNAITFNVTIDQADDISWYVDSSLAETDSGSTEGHYTFPATAAGEYNITAPVFGDSQTWIITVSPNQIISYLPVDTTPYIKPNTAQTFTVNLDGAENVTWKLNGSTVQTNTSVTAATYTFNNTGGTDYNIPALISADSQTWIADVGGTHIKDSYVVGSFVVSYIVASYIIYRNNTRRR